MKENILDVPLPRHPGRRRGRFSFIFVETVLT
jgi:hypothetical protein